MGCGKSKKCCGQQQQCFPQSQQQCGGGLFGGFQAPSFPQQFNFPPLPPPSLPQQCGGYQPQVQQRFC